MCNKRTFILCFSAVVMGLALFLLPFFATTPVYAQSSDGGRSPDGAVDNGTCIGCHEDLYFNHDTGQWFCIRESPMSCVFCHGGDPTATTQEGAHYDRSAHPVVNEDISVCRDCHPEDCFDCVSAFDRVAGIKDVRMAAPVIAPHASKQIPGLPATEKQEPVNWLLLFDVLVVIVVISLAVTFYAVRIARQS